MIDIATMALTEIFFWLWFAYTVYKNRRYILCCTVRCVTICKILLHHKVKSPAVSFTFVKYTIYDLCQNIRNGTIHKSLIYEYIIDTVLDDVVQQYNLGNITIENNVYVLTYRYNGGYHTVRFPKNRRVRQITRVDNFVGTPITDEFIKALGPANNFHGIPTTPRILGHEKLFITYRDDQTVCVDVDDYIQLDPPEKPTKNITDTHNSWEYN
jgi:hypothetical protein